MYNIPKLIQKKQKLSPFDQSQPTTVNIKKDLQWPSRKSRLEADFLKLPLSEIKLSEIQLSNTISLTLMKMSDKGQTFPTCQ